MRKSNSAQPKVFVQGRFANGSTRRIFQESAQGYLICESVQDADIVVWTGGEDIDPRLYGEQPIPGVHYNGHRDAQDCAAIEACSFTDKFLVGICRGAQLLNCLPNGGKLWQDVDGHGYGAHKIWDMSIPNPPHQLMVNSLHHQMMKPTKEAVVVAYGLTSTYKQAFTTSWSRLDEAVSASVYDESEVDPEVVWYPKTKSLLVQFHPEFGHKPTTEYFFQLMDRYFWGNRSEWTDEEIAQRISEVA